MKKVFQISGIILIVIFFYRLLFCNFLVVFPYFKNTFSTPLKEDYPKGILSPIAKNKFEKPILNYLKNKDSEPFIWHKNNFEILSIVDGFEDKEIKEVLTFLGKDEKSTHVLFYFKSDKIIKTEEEK